VWRQRDERQQAETEILSRRIRDKSGVGIAHGTGAHDHVVAALRLRWGRCEQQTAYEYPPGYRGPFAPRLPATKQLHAISTVSGSGMAWRGVDRRSITEVTRKAMLGNSALQCNSNRRGCKQKK
jgi:hypothetical protein